MNIQRDHIDNLRRDDETLRQMKNRIEAREQELSSRLDQAVSRSLKLPDERASLQKAIASSFKRESAQEAKLLQVATKASQLVTKYKRLVDQRVAIVRHLTG
jgi:septal ring factor EnvC (AmiA/AmiB activator)